MYEVIYHIFCNMDEVVMIHVTYMDTLQQLLISLSQSGEDRQRLEAKEAAN